MMVRHHLCRVCNRRARKPTEVTQLTKLASILTQLRPAMSESHRTHRSDMPTLTVQRARIVKGQYCVDNKTLRLYCVLGFKRNRTVVIYENCRTGTEFEMRVD